MKQKIIEGAERLFFQYGVRSVSMDDVSRELSMSKKTLYQYFTNKDELVQEVASYSLEQEKLSFRGISEHAQNAIDEIFQISQCIRNTVKNMNPSLMYDLKKYHPEAWKVFEDFKYDFIKGTVAGNIRRGISEGFYRPDLNAELLSTLRVETIQLIFDGVFSKLDIPFQVLQLQLFEHFVYGMLLPEGHQEYAKYKLIEANQSHS